MNIILLGPPGGGKGAIAQALEKYKFRQISTGDLIREAIKNEDKLAPIFKGFIDKGELVPDKYIIKLIEENVKEGDNLIFDGIPRTIEQAQALDESFTIDRVILISVRDDIVLERLTNRRICPKCKKVYNLKTMPPKKEGLCDDDGEKLIQRDDDKEEVIMKRLKEFKSYSQDLLSYYTSVEEIDGNGNIKDVVKEVIKVLKLK